MNDEKIPERSDARALFENYLAAFSIVSPDERKTKLQMSVTETIAFSNPGVEGRGKEALLEHIAQFQTRFPGGHFRINWFRQQHNQILAEWTQLDEENSELITAHSYAVIGEDGLIEKFAGFWEKFPD